MDIEYGINDLKNTPLRRLIQERINSDNLKWEDGKVVIFQVYYDPAFQIKEANAMSLATN